MDEACLICGFLLSEHEHYEGTPPNYRTAFICPGGESLFLGLDPLAEIQEAANRFQHGSAR